MFDTEMNVLLFELGSIQVFSKMSIEDAMAGLESKEVYWQDKVSKYTYGPFPTIYDCMTHYTGVISSQKNPVIGEEFRAPVIYVDFTNKRRMHYE